MGLAVRGPGGLDDGMRRAQSPPGLHPFASSAARIGPGMPRDPAAIPRPPASNSHTRRIPDAFDAGRTSGRDPGHGRRHGPPDRCRTDFYRIGITGNGLIPLAFPGRDGTAAPAVHAMPSFRHLRRPSPSVDHAGLCQAIRGLRLILKLRNPKLRPVLRNRPFLSP